MIYININPTIVDFGFYKINFYGLCAAIATIVFFVLIFLDKKRQNIISDEDILTFFITTTFAGIFGAKALFILENWSDFKNLSLTQQLGISDGGFSLLGGIIAVSFAILISSRLKNISFWNLADRFALYAPIFQIIARIGCLGAGCCAGIPCNYNNFFAVCYLNKACWAPTNVPLLPNPLFSMIFSLLIFMILKYLDKTQKKPGIIANSYLALEGFARFIVDFWRIDTDRSFVSQISSLISINQVIAAIISIVAITNLYFVFKKMKTK